MLAGMYVVHEGTTCQVVRIIDVHGVHTDYHLQPVDGGPSRYVRDPLGVDVPLTAPCEPCQRPAGHSACAAKGEHVGPAQPVQLPPLPAPRPLSRTRAWCETCRRSQTVVDESMESTYTSYGEVGYAVLYLACGHDNSREVGVIGPAPGGPAPMPRSWVLGQQSDPWDSEAAGW